MVPTAIVSCFTRDKAGGICISRLKEKWSRIIMASRRNCNYFLRALVFVTAFAFIRSELLERRPQLCRYQDAWKALKVPGKYYLVMRSYEKEPFYKNRKCVYNELVSVNEEERYTVNIIGSIDPSDGSRSNQTAYAWVRASEGYPIPNIIQTSL
ncbi:hypothetical protein V5799_008074 [Amblyomma americanum]|uniref:Lipocalin n=1 Tax=Amblyomma americanum TaxID=6943 RepID=A0AAQ4FFU4_AMBAM